MNRLLHIFTLAVALMLLSGCSTRRDYRTAIDALLTEMRSVETQYYELESAYRRQGRELEAARKKLQDLEGTRPAAGFEGVPEIDDGQPLSGSPPAGELPLDGLTPSVLEEIPQLEELNWGSIRESSSATYDAEQSSYVAPIDNRISHIMLSEALTVGRDLDGRGGDDAISVVIEPRNADNELLAQAGRVTVSLIDPLAEGEDQRIGLWTIESPEAYSRLRISADAAPGIHLILPWQDRLPERKDLKLFVRLEADDGGVHETATDISVILTEEGVHGWTQRPSPGSFNVDGPREESAPPRQRLTAGVPAWSPYR